MAHYSAQIFVLLTVLASLAFSTPIDTSAPTSANQEQRQPDPSELVSIETVKLESLPKRQGRQYFGYPVMGGGYSGSSAYASGNSGAGGFGGYPGFGGGYSGPSAMASSNSGAGGFYGKK